MALSVPASAADVRAATTTLAVSPSAVSTSGLNSRITQRLQVVNIRLTQLTAQLQALNARITAIIRDRPGDGPISPGG